MTQAKIKELLDMLNTVNEYILSLPDDMLLTIDPRDNESIQHGLAFIQAFNDNAAAFSDAATRLERQIKAFFQINPEDDELEKGPADHQRIVKELDKTRPHTLEESFTYKRPYGFVLGNAAYKGIKTWRSLYLQTLTELRALDAARFARLPQAPTFISKRGKPWFATDPDEFRAAEPIGDGLYAEVNLSANNIRDNIIDLLTHFNLDYREMKIYLREDRDA